MHTFPFHKERVFVEIVVPKYVRVGVQWAFKYAFLIIVYSRRLVLGPSTAFSIDRDFDPAENVKVLRSTLFVLYRARTPLLSTRLCVDKMTGLGCTRVTSR